MNKLLVALGLAATLSGATGTHLAAQQSPAQSVGRSAAAGVADRLEETLTPTWQVSR